MKRFIVETSLFEPIEVDICGKVYTSQPLSNKLIKAVGEVEAQIRDKKISDLDGSIQIASLIFGVPAEEFETIDLRALTPALDYAMNAINEGRVQKKPADPAATATAETDPKN